jgi:nucleoside-diphosphate-sugar epimerase
VRILVTGASGFSGSALSRTLLAQGHHVFAAVGRGVGRLEPGEGAGRLEVLPGDLSADLALPTRLDAIVHAAARSPAPGVTPQDLQRDNVIATRRIVEHAVRAAVPKVIFFSSLSLYGRINAPVVDEDTPVTEPDQYGITKRVGEEMLAATGDALHSLSIRLPGVIGRRPVRNWLANVLAAAREGAEITIYNPEARFNNAVHVSDLGRWIAALLQRTWQGHDAVTIAAAGDIPVGEAVRDLVRAFGNRSAIRVDPARKASFLVSSERARLRYGYRPMHIAEMLRVFAEENREP